MIAFDTNVLIYAFDQDSPAKQRRATDLIRFTSDGVILWQVACEFVAASGKLAGRGFSPESAWVNLSRFLELWPLLLPGPNVLGRAREMHMELQWSFWDSLIVAACVEAGVERLYSEDLPGRAAPSGLEIVNPFA